MEDFCVGPPKKNKNIRQFLRIRNTPRMDDVKLKVSQKKMLIPRIAWMEFITLRYQNSISTNRKN